MRNQTRRHIRRINRAKSRRHNIIAVFACIALLVAAGVALALRQNGRAATRQERVLSCPVSGTVAHTHDGSCYDDNGNLACALPEVERHVHDDFCYEEQAELVCGMSEGEGAHWHDDSCYDEGGNLTCGLEETAGHVHDDSCYKVERSLVCGKGEVAEEHQHGPGCFQTIEVADAMPAQAFEHRFTDKDDRLVLDVRVDAPEGALPEGSTMEAEWVDTEAKKNAEVKTAVEEAVAKKTDAEVAQVHAVDITFRDAEGNDVEPAKKVTVTMASSQIASEDTNQLLVHVESDREAQERAGRQGKDTYQIEGSVNEPLSARQLQKRGLPDEADELVFDADQFSVYAVVYTVDFHYNVGGRTYELSLQGGDAVNLRELLGSLKVFEAKDADLFMAEVKDVTFSDTSLVAVAHVGESITAGELRERFDLRAQYSAEVTEKQIAAMDAKRFEPGDWALLSLKPFTSEEALTVTMKNGEVFTVRVTDGQITTHVLTADGYTFEVTVTYGDDAKIPEGAWLAAEEITEERAYQEYVSKTAETLGRDLAKSYARFFDISIMDAEGNEIQPATEVTVQINLIDKNVKEGMEVVHFGESAELMNVSQNEDSLRFGTKGFSVFAIVAIDTEEGSYVFHGDGFTITVSHTAEAKIPLGTTLTVEEIDPESDEYIQRLGQAWYEVNREYFEVEEKRANYNEGMGDYPDLPDLNLVNLDAARFFDISFEYNGKEIEPNDAVHVEISYDEGLKALGDGEPVCGVAHFGEDAVELIEDVEIKTDKDGGVVSFEYEQSSFSDTGTYVGQETYDAKTHLPQAAAPEYDPEKAITLASSNGKGLLGAGKGNGNTATNGLLGSSNTNPLSPASSKTLTPNKVNGHKDGTYTLTLSVAGSSRSNNTAEVNRSNVLIVMDRSSSMVNNNVKIYSAYNGNPESGVTYYGKEGDGYFQLFTYNNGYYKTRTQSWNGRVTYSDPYTGQVYTATEGDKRLDAEQAALSSLISQLLAKNNEFKQDNEGYLLDENNNRVLDESGDPIKVNDIIEMSVISFADRALGDYPRNDNVGPAPSYGTEVGWSTDYDTLMTGVNKDRAPSGTNWEDALRYAQYIADTKHNAQPDEPMFVIFLTDGEPTAKAGETGGAKHYIDKYGNVVSGGFEEAYKPAKDEARALVTSGYEFYGIFTYGEGEAQVGYLKRLVNVAYGHADDTTQTDDLTEHFHDAGDNEALLAAFQHILSKISGTISVGNVTVNDGLTTDATASTLVSGRADGFRYTVTGPLGELYSATASGDDSDPTVTFTINGQSVPGTKKTEHVTRNQVDANGDPIPDPDNPGKYKTVTEQKTYYSATVGTTEYKMALASIEDDGQITWDLSAVGTLMEGYSYNCSFVVWPEQEAYDYVAGLNNKLDGFEWDENAATEVKGENGDVIYYTNGVSRYPSIVKYPNGTFAVLTNTNQSVTYSIVDTKTNETTGETETTYDGPYTKPLEYPDPMDLTGSSLSITKYWDDSMDAQQLKDVVDDYAEQHPGETYSVTLTMYENGKKYKDYTFYPVWDAEKSCYTWKSADFSIAPALLVSKHPGGSKTYKTVTIDGTRYYVLNDGHEYTLDEEVQDYHFEFSADSYHPALVDGVLYNVKFEVDGNGYIVDGSTATKSDRELETFTGTNTLKGRLYVKKKTVVPEGTKGVDLAKTTFDVKITLTDRNGQPISSPLGEDGNYDAESGLMYRIHYGPYHPHGSDWTQYENYGRSEKKAVEDGMITETIYSGDEIYVGNMPVGTHYEVEETSMPTGWRQVGIVAKDENGKVDPQQIIYGNKADRVTITNTVPSFDVNILKTSEDGSQPLGNAHFKLYGSDYYVTDEGGNTVVNQNPTVVAENLVSDAKTGLIPLGQLGGGEYYLVETDAPEGYLRITEPIRIVVDGTSEQTRAYDDEPTTRPVYVTYTQDGNSLSESGNGVAIDATPLTDASGTQMTDEDGNKLYNYSFTLTVTNTSGAELPAAGGPGTQICTILGCVMVLGAGALLCGRRRFA